MSAFPYAVEFGPSLHERVSFATFEHALAFYRGYTKAMWFHARPGLVRDDGPRLRNIDRSDGAEDGNPSGLTADEREHLSNAE